MNWPCRLYFDLLELIGQINAAWKKAGFQRFAVNQLNLVGTKSYKHHTNLLPPNRPLNMHTARVGSGIGALAVKKKAAARTAQEEILLELKPIKNQKTKRPTIKKDQVITNRQSEFISSTRNGPLFLGQSSSRMVFFASDFLTSKKMKTPDYLMTQSSNLPPRIKQKP